MKGHAAWLLVLLAILGLPALLWLLREEEGPPESAPMAADETSSRALGLRPQFGGGVTARVGVGHADGRVLDFGTGEYVAGARIRWEGVSNEGRKVRGETTSAGDGSFRLVGLPAGDNYTLHVEHAGAPPQSRVGLRVFADTTAQLSDIWLGERSAFEGRLLDVEGRGVRDAHIELFYRSESSGSWMGGIFNQVPAWDREPVAAGAGKSDAEGRFRIDELDPGAAYVRIRAAGFQQVVLPIALTPAGVAEEPWKAVLVAREPLRGRVVDAEGRGVADARVALFDYRDDAAQIGGLMRSYAETDASGTFAFNAPPERLARLELAVASTGRATAWATLDEAKPEVVVVLPPEADVLVRLVDASNGMPLAGATLALVSGNNRWIDDRGVAFATTNTLGEARLWARQGDLRTVYVNHPAAGLAMFDVARTRPRMESLLLASRPMNEVRPGGGTLELALGIGPLLAGEVRDGDGRPLPGVLCYAFGFDGMGAIATTNAAGRYEMRLNWRDAKPGMPLVMVRSPGYDAQPVAREALAPARDFVMRRTVPVVGRVLDETGRPLVGAEVHLHDEATIWSSPSAISGPNGRYLAAWRGHGVDAIATASCAGYVGSGVTAIVQPSSDPFQMPDLRLSRGFSLVVRVRDPEGRVVRGARVVVHMEHRDGGDNPQFRSWQGPPPFVDLATGGAGTVRVDALAPGTATITVMAPGTAGARHVLVLRDEPAQSIREVDVRLRPAATLVGRVLAQSGEPIAGAEVHVAHASGGYDWADFYTKRQEGPVPDWLPARSALTDPDGRFEIPDLPRIGMDVAVYHESYLGSNATLEAGAEGNEIRLPAR